MEPRYSLAKAIIQNYKTSGVICEILNDDGTMAHVPDLVHFCKVHGLNMIIVAHLTEHRLENDHAGLFGGRRRGRSTLRFPNGRLAEERKWSTKSCSYEIDPKGVMTCPRYRTR